jgi:hypothetical protein
MFQEAVMRFVTSAAFAFALAVSASAMAEEPARPVLDAVIKACGADIKQFCPDVQPGGGRILK